MTTVGAAHPRRTHDLRRHYVTQKRALGACVGFSGPLKLNFEWRSYMGEVGKENKSQAG